MYRYTVYPDNKNHPYHKISEKRQGMWKNVKKMMTSHFKSTSETKGKYYEEYPGKVGGDGILATNS